MRQIEKIAIGRLTVSVKLDAAIFLSSVAIASAPIAFASDSRAERLSPVGYAMARHIGWRVDRFTHAGICVRSSGHECLSLMPSAEAGGFNYPSSVAVNPVSGDLYVADSTNYRVQRFTASGSFVSMFGWGVNLTQVLRSRSLLAARNVCTAKSGDRCTSGASGAAEGQLTYPTSVAVDPFSGDVYVLEVNSGDSRVAKYTADGRFVWSAGKGVNDKTGGNLCTGREVERSGAHCRAGAENPSERMEHEAFKFEPQYGDMLAVGGHEDLLYVGDEHRVQELDANGRWRGEVSLVSASAAPASIVSAVALDPEGELYLVYRTVRVVSGQPLEEADLVRRFDRAGEQVGEIRVLAGAPQAAVHIDGIAIDGAGRMAVIGVEVGPRFHARFGRLYELRSGRPIGEFQPPRDNNGLTFGADGDLYVAATDSQEVVIYAPGPPASLLMEFVPCEMGNEGLWNGMECVLDGTRPHRRMQP
jgi:tripartite motif-containing protein 71